MPDRIPGLTPYQHACLRRDVVAAIGGSAPGEPAADAALSVVAGRFRELAAIRDTEVARLARRLVGLADSLRVEGRLGLALDLDLLAGVLAGLQAREVERGRAGRSVQGYPAPPGGAMAAMGVAAGAPKD